jgi:Flp pilus assembly pilin Flp
MNTKKTGQTVLEYALLLAIVSAAFMTMSVYVRRTVQGQLYKIDQRVAAKDVTPPAGLTPPAPCYSWPIC